MTEITAEEKDRRQRGVLLISRRVHMDSQKNLASKPHLRQRIVGDVTFLQDALVRWKDDGTPFSKAVRQLVQAAVGEAARAVSAMRD